jgi:hypothetical protein
MNNWNINLAVDKIDGSHIPIGNRGRLVRRATIEVKFTDGTSSGVELPVETWLSRKAMPGKLRTGKDQGRHD